MNDLYFGRINGLNECGCLVFGITQAYYKFIHYRKDRGDGLHQRIIKFYGITNKCKTTDFHGIQIWKTLSINIRTVKLHLIKLFLEKLLYHLFKFLEAFFH